MRQAKIRYSSLVWFGSLATLGGLAFTISWSIVHSQEKPKQPITARPLSVTVSTLQEGSTRGKARFTLTNHSNGIVDIENITSTCRCVETSDAAGASIRPGKSLPVEFDVALPEFGVSNTTVEVTTSADTTPILLEVKAVGHGHVPAKIGVTDGSPRFIGLESTTENRLIEVDTVEQPGSEPWLTDMECELKEVEIDQVNVVEKPYFASGVIKRKYTYKVGWKSLPHRREFLGLITCNTRNTAEPPLNIGVLVGTRSKQIPLSPPTDE